MAAPIPWLDEVKRTGKLTIALDASIGQQGWAKAFRDGIATFNELPTCGSASPTSRRTIRRKPT